jgi:predicted phosphodiesterase
MKRAIVIPDQHFPIHDENALKVVLKAIEFVKPDIFINLGDVGEWESVSAWAYKRRKRPPIEYQLVEMKQEIKAVNKCLDRIDRVLDKIKCKSRFILAGNHDEWLDAWVEENPFLDQYTFRNACKWDERGYDYRRYNEVLSIGKLNFIHGAYTTATHAKKHLDAYGANIVYGHTHDIQRYSHTKLDDDGIAAWSMGCLKDMSAENNTWLKGRLHNWNHAFGVITWFDDGLFQLETIEIVKGKCSVWGKIIKG